MTKRKPFAGTILAVVAAALGMVLLTQEADAQGAPPPIPAVYSGIVTSNEGSVPNGLILTARIGDDYESRAVVIEDGKYKVLRIAPPDNTFQGDTITFHLDGVQAEQTDSFSPGGIKLRFNLTFPRIPEPTPTAAPIVVAPSVYSGVIVVAGTVVPQDAELVAIVGDYESAPALIAGQSFVSLVIAPGDESFTGMPVQFFLNRVPATGVTEVFEPGVNKTITLVFIGLPTPTATTVPPTPTFTPEPPTPTPTVAPVPPTPTPVLEPPTPTRVPTHTPTATPTEVPPTQTPVVIVVTATPEGEAPPDAEEEGGGICGASLGGPLTLAGTLNVVALFAPLGLITGYRRWRQWGPGK